LGGSEVVKEVKAVVEVLVRELVRFSTSKGVVGFHAVAVVVVVWVSISIHRLSPKVWLALVIL